MNDDQHVETLYALKRSGRGPRSSEICYLMQPSIKQLWDTIVETEWMGTGHTVETLRAAGWKAVKVCVQEMTTPVSKHKKRPAGYNTRICQDCGRHGEMTGHMDCMYPGGAA